jgi:hypothetical protein
MDIYAQYNKLYRAEKAAKHAQELLKPRLEAYVARHEEPVRKEYGTFYLADSVAYVYSERVAKLEADLAEIKLQEQADGVATKKTHKSLRFRMK